MDWLLQAKPDDYDIDSALKHKVFEGTWLTPKHQQHIKVGDTALIWRCGPNAALVATAEILTLPARIETNPDERKFERRPVKFTGKQWRVRLRMQPLNAPVSRKTLLDDSVARKWKVIHGCEGTVFRVPPDVSAAITRIIGS